MYQSHGTKKPLSFMDSHEKNSSAIEDENGIIEKLQRTSPEILFLKTSKT